MASTAKTVAGIIPGVMSIGLLGRTLKFLPSEKELKGKKKGKPVKIVPLFAEVAVGVPLIGATVGMVAKLP